MVLVTMAVMIMIAVIINIVTRVTIVIVIIFRFGRAVITDIVGMVVIEVTKAIAVILVFFSS